MKKSVLKIVALLMIAIIACTALASCGKKLSGSYKGEINVLVASYEVVYDFSGNKVTVTHQVKSLLGNADPVEVEGTYKITETAGGDLEIAFEFEKEDDVVKSAKYDFEEGEDYIKINKIKYTKVEK